MATSNGRGFRVRAERCSSCLFRLRYDRRTRERILNECRENDTFVACRQHEGGVCCNGYYTAIGEAGCTAVQLALRFERRGVRVVEWVGDGDYPPREEEDHDGDDDQG